MPKRKRSKPDLYPKLEFSKAEQLHIWKRARRSRYKHPLQFIYRQLLGRGPRPRPRTRTSRPSRR